MEIYSVGKLSKIGSRLFLAVVYITVFFPDRYLYTRCIICKRKAYIVFIAKENMYKLISSVEQYKTS